MSPRKEAQKQKQHEEQQEEQQEGQQEEQLAEQQQQEKQNSGLGLHYLPTGKPRGPRPIATPEVLFENLKNFPIFEETGAMVHISDPVWQKVCNQIPGLKVKNLYYYLQQNRRNVRADLLKHHNITPSKKIKKHEQPSQKKWGKVTNKQPDFSYYDTIDNEDDDEAAQVNDFHHLILLTKFKKYKNSVRELNYQKFSVIYFDQEQINVWKDLSIVDATVSFIVLDKIISHRLISSIANRLFMFALAIKIENSVILLAQMVSEMTHTIVLENFLNVWLQKAAPAPSHIVVDYVYEMLNGTSRVLNFCTFNEYNTRCYKYLLNEEPELPNTLLQVDIVGLIKVVDSWDTFVKVPQPVKDFYLCSIMYLSTVTDIDEFTESVTTILILCQSPGKSEKTEERKKTLWNHLTSSVVQRLHKKYMDYVVEEGGYRSFSHLTTNPNKDKYEPMELLNFANELKIKALDYCNFSDDEESENIYCCKKIINDLIVLFSEFPSWTKIVFKKENCGYLLSLCTSKHVAYLKELNKPLRPSKFIKYHIQKLKCLTLQGKALAKIARKNSSLTGEERKNNHLFLSHGTQGNPLFDNRIEINVGDLTTFNSRVHFVDGEGHDDEEFMNVGLEVFRTSVQSASYALVELNKSIESLIDNTEIDEDEACKYVKVLLDCCAEMDNYDNIFGTIAEKLAKNNAFAESLRQIFSDCYNTASLLSKSEIKNTCKLFAHLLITDSIPWKILATLKLKEEEMTTAKQDFIKELLQEISEFMGISKLERKIRQEASQATFKGLYPDNILDASYAESFFKSFGFGSLWSLFKENMYRNSTKEHETPPPEKEKPMKINLKRTASESSIVSGGSDDSSENYVIELKLSDLKKAHKKKKVIVIK